MNTEYQKKNGKIIKAKQANEKKNVFGGENVRISKS